MDRHDVNCPYYGILFSRKKKVVTQAITWVNNIMLKEPDTKGQILYYSTYIPTVVTFIETKRNGGY